VIKTPFPLSFEEIPTEIRSQERLQFSHGTCYPDREGIHTGNQAQCQGPDCCRDEPSVESIFLRPEICVYPIPNPLAQCSNHILCLTVKHK
jgi:hypothetical protein